ncbi:unnamed protein product [Urochloa decumbens]|uniref:Peptidase A1 domain-containing protein n=1 Tax=Urochloa decumbens TaxID=240449 RepID=A0ABC9AIG7_9POAL
MNAMAHRAHLLLVVLVQLLCLAAAVTVAFGSAGFRADLNHPYAGSPLSAHELVRRSARASRARLARLDATLARHLGDPSAADVPLAPLTDQGYTVSVGIGTPPQQQTLIIDTASNPIWTQCKLFRGTAAQREPPYDPVKSSSFAFLPCSSWMCKKGQPGSTTCSNTTRRCLFGYNYGSAAADGVIASEAFTLGARRKVRIPAVTFGCGNLTGGSLIGASGILGLAPGAMSLVSQLKAPRFSYCLAPFSARKPGALFFGAKASLERYGRIGGIQTTSILKNPSPELASLYYYVPMVGLSIGSRRLAVPATSLAMKLDGSGGTIVDSGSTIMYLVEPAFKKLKDAVLGTLKLPVANTTTEDYKLCFSLPRGMLMSAVKTPPLVLHFGGGADMILPQENYFQEPRPGLMCLAVSSSNSLSMIGNVQQQNMHVLFDIVKLKFSFARAQCDLM